MMCATRAVAPLRCIYHTLKSSRSPTRPWQCFSKDTSSLVCRWQSSSTKPVKPAAASTGKQYDPNVLTPLPDALQPTDFLAQTNKTQQEIAQLNPELVKLYRGNGPTIKQALEGSYVIRTVNRRVPSGIPVEIRDGLITVGDRNIPNIWLRDNCQCGSCMHEETKQRLLDTFRIPQDISIHTHESDANGINVDWSDGHKSYYKNSLLQAATESPEQRAIVRQGLTDVNLWGTEIQKDPPSVEHDQVLSDKESGILSVLERIRKFGFCFIYNVDPTDPLTTKHLLEKISFIRETHYGGFYDFTADLASKDTAYTNIVLEAHTDTTYFSDPAGLQSFHLLSHTHGSGGSSLLVDGFKVASDLLHLDPSAYHTLAATPIHGHASGNAGISIQPYKAFPVFSHDPSTGNLLQVRWNSSDRAGIGLPVSETGRWYDAARKFDALLKKSENEYWEQLVPGRVLLFDNWRVLHGRGSFTGKRRICGAYISRDDWVSRFKMLRWGQEEVLGSLPAS